VLLGEALALLRSVVRTWAHTHVRYPLRRRSMPLEVADEPDRMPIAAHGRKRRFDRVAIPQPIALEHHHVHQIHGETEDGQLPDELELGEVATPAEHLPTQRDGLQQRKVEVSDVIR